MCVQYIRGCSVHQDVFSTSGVTMSTSGGYHEYIGGCSVHQRDTMSISGDIQYIGGLPWVHQGISWVHWQMVSTLGDVQYIGVFNRNWKEFIKLLPHMYNDIPLMYWTSSNVLMISQDVLMVSLQCTEHPGSTHDIPPMYSWYPPNVLMISPLCTEHPPMYWTSPDVLNIPWCTEHTLYRVMFLLSCIQWRDATLALQFINY